MSGGSIRAAANGGDGFAVQLSPHRLWSLWEMLELHAHSFFDALNTLADLDRIARDNPDWLYQDEGHRKYMTNALDELLKHLQALDLRLAIKKATHINNIVAMSEGKDPKLTASLISRNLDELRERIVQSLEDRLIYHVTPKQADYINNGLSLFGDKVSEKFVAASYDLDEAAKCLGMLRSTACVFHLMRAMEHAVIRLGDKLSVTIINKHGQELEWGIILGNLNDAINAMPKGDERDELSGVCSLLYHVKQAWRNSTMHPKQTYTEDEAEAVFNAVRSFLRSLAAVL